MTRNLSMRLTCFAGAAVCLLGAGTEPSVADDNAVDFTQHVLPLLQTHCYDCHGDDQAEAELRLNSLPGINAGGQSGLVIVPGSAEESLLIGAVRYADESLQMPPDGKLSDGDIELLTRWVNQGARHPDGVVLSEPVAPPFDPDEARSYWAFRPVQPVPVPQVENPAHVWSPIDAFVVAELEAAGLAPNPVADRHTLIRRATLDLTGLPPTPDDVAAFLADDSPDAFARVVDRLLESSAYGERWGRHWLDVVRYADSNGLDENVAHGTAWRYRDYVIASFNRDQPIDDFIREQLAGDLLTGDGQSEAERNELLVATGFLSLGPKVLAEGDEVKLHMDIVDEQIDTVGRAFLGLTLGCARCHDHKFDPVSQADYYRLAGIFESTRTMESLKRIARWNENELITQEHRDALAAHQQQVAAQEAAIRQLLAGLPGDACPVANDDSALRDESELTDDERERLRSLRDDLTKLQEQIPVADTAMGVADGDVHNSRLYHRGSHLTPGRVVGRGVPAVLDIVPLAAIRPEESGRRQLAEWLIHPEHPLTARVFANRVWRWHFGRGLVPSTDNFGLRGESPLNQPLLDWLAAELVHSDWSLKALHRSIMLSRTYALSAGEAAAGMESDPDNLLWWRYPQRRLEAEAVRDSVLAVSGLLDRTMGGSLLHVENREFIFNHTSQDGTSYDSFRRSVYLPVVRNNLYDGFSLFDYTDASVTNGNRSTSTVASQSLFLMNSELLTQAATALSHRLAALDSDSERVRTLYELCVNRSPSDAEITQHLQAVADFRTLLAAEGMSEPDSQSKAWTATCHTMLMSTEFICLP